MTFDVAFRNTAAETAAAAGDRAALIDAARATAARVALPTHAVTAFPLTTLQAGAMLLLGQNRPAAGQIARHLSTHVGSQIVLVAALDETKLPAVALLSLADLRLLNDDWRELPAGVGKPSAWMRPRIARRRRLLQGLARRDPKLAASSIAALGREDAKTRFSLLAYALYLKARAAGIAVKVPRKYDF